MFKLEIRKNSIFDFSINVELKWKMSVDLWGLQQMQYISLRGEQKYSEISCKLPTSPKVSNIYITSRPQQELIQQKVTIANLLQCLQIHLDCYEIHGNNMIYFVYSNISSYSSDQPASDDPNFSWRTGNFFCKLIGSELLYFTNGEELGDFTAMLLEISEIPFLEAVFIGLRYNGLKVNLLKLYEQYIFLVEIVK